VEYSRRIARTDADTDTDAITRQCNDPSGGDGDSG
jgi:hypothetical protein